MKAFISIYPFAYNNENLKEQFLKHKIQLVENPLNKKMTADDILKYLDDSDVLICGTEEITEEILKIPSLKAIFRVGAGYNNIDESLAKKHNVFVYITPYIPSYAASEQAIALMWEALKKISFHHQEMKKGIWNKHETTLLSGLTVGLFGFGNVSQVIVRSLAPFHLKMLVNDLHHNWMFEQLDNIKFVDKKEIFKESDIIFVSGLPLNESTNNLIDKEAFDMMKTTAILINTARGGIVNEEELYIALLNNKIQYASSDVFVQEPYNGPLLKLDNFTATPHIGSYTQKSRRMMEEQVLQNIIYFSENNFTNRVI